MVHIFRIEDRQGRGIFQMDESLTLRYPKLMEQTPADDPPIRAAIQEMNGQWRANALSLRIFGEQAENNRRANYKNWYYGFESRAQLEDMFPDSIALLSMKNRGFHLSVYNVKPEDVHFGQYQCLFYRQKAVFVEAYDLRSGDLLPVVPQTLVKRAPLLGLFGGQPV